jgi:hypothetical protein
MGRSSINAERLHLRRGLNIVGVLFHRDSRYVPEQPEPLVQPGDWATTQEISTQYHLTPESV